MAGWAVSGLATSSMGSAPLAAHSPEIIARLTPLRKAIRRGRARVVRASGARGNGPAGAGLRLAGRNWKVHRKALAARAASTIPAAEPPGRASADDLRVSYLHAEAAHAQRVFGPLR